MAKEKEITPEEQVAKDVKENAQWVADVQEWYEEDQNYRAIEVDKQWMVNKAYYEGRQNFRYDTTRKEIVQDDKDPLRFYINLIKMALNAVTTAILKDAPIWDIDGKPYSSWDPDDGQKLSFFMTDLYDQLDMDKKLDQCVRDAFLFGHGIFQYGYEVPNDGQGVLWVDTLNPFDVYFGGRAATGVHDADRITKVVQRSVKSVRNNEAYIEENRVKVKADNKSSSSAHERKLDKASGVSNSDTEGTVLVHEMWLRDSDEVTEDGRPRIRVVTFTEGGILLRNELTEFTRFPFVTIDIDKLTGDVYTKGWAADLVPLNRTINYLERKVLKFNATMAAGKYVVTEDSNVETISNESGEILKVSAGGQLSHLPMAPMSSTPFNQINNLMRYFQDISGAQEAFLGRAPSGVTAGIAFEQLAANAFSNISGYIRAVSMALEELGEEMLTLANEKFVASREFRTMDESGEIEVMKVIGKNGELEKGEGVIKLPDVPKVRVSIVSESSFTKSARKDDYLQMYQMGLIDGRTVRELFDLDTDEVEARLAYQGQIGNPIPKDSEKALEEQAAQAEQAPVEGSEPAPEEMVAAFVAEAQAQGLEIDPQLTEEDILAIVMGEVQMDPAMLEQGIVTVAV